MAGVIFNAIAKAHLLQHFQVVFSADSEPLRFEQFVLRLEQLDPIFQLGANRAQCAVQLVRRSDELLGGIKSDHAERFMRVTGERLKTRDCFDLIAEELDPHRFFVGRGRINFNYVAADAEFAAGEVHVVTLVEHVDQTAEDRFARDVLTPFYRQQHVQIIFRRGDAVDAGNTRHDDGVASREQRACRRQPQSLNLFVNR